MFKRTAAIAITVFVSVTCILIPAYATDLDSDFEESITSDYQFVSSSKTELVINNGTATIRVTVADRNTNTSSIKTTATLQKKSGAIWVDVTKWDKTSKNNILILSASKIVPKGTYRVKNVTYAYNNSNYYEMITQYSPTKTR